jgi:hypothetical protein
MDYSRTVDQDFVNNILESSMWQKASVKVIKEESENDADLDVVPELSHIDGDLKELDGDCVYPGDGDQEEGEFEEELEESEEEEQESFSLDDLQYVLDNLADDDLLEHAANMLEVFDTAYETLNEDEEEEEVEELEEDYMKGYGDDAPPMSAAAKKIAMARKKKKARRK